VVCRRKGDEHEGKEKEVDLHVRSLTISVWGYKEVGPRKNGMLGKGK